MTTSEAQRLIKHRQRRTATAPNPIVEGAAAVTNKRGKGVEGGIVPETNVLDLEVAAKARRKLVIKGKEITTMTMVINSVETKQHRIHLQRREARNHPVVSKTHLPSAVEKIERRTNAVGKVLVIRIISIKMTNRIKPRIAMKIRNKRTMKVGAPTAIRRRNARGRAKKVIRMHNAPRWIQF